MIVKLCGYCYQKMKNVYRASFSRYVQSVRPSRRTYVVLRSMIHRYEYVSLSLAPSLLSKWRIAHKRDDILVHLDTHHDHPHLILPSLLLQPAYFSALPSFISNTGKYGTKKDCCSCDTTLGLHLHGGLAIVLEYHYYK